MWSKTASRKNPGSGSQFCEESVGLTAVSENDHIDTICVIQQLIIILAVLSVERQNIAVKGDFVRVKMLNAVSSHIWSYLAKVG